MRTYSVIRNSRLGPGPGTETVEATGLDWESASAKLEELRTAEEAAKPGTTSWTRDVFYRRHEKQSQQ